MSQLKVALSLIQRAHLRSESANMLFIVGCGRSGNTLMRRVLMENFSIYIPPETYVLQKITYSSLNGRALRWSDQVNLILATFQYHKEFKTFNIQSLIDVKESCQEIPPKERSTGNVVLELYKYLAKTNGCDVDWYGDKTPMNTLHLGIMKKLFPNAKYIFMVRDPIDVVASYLNSGIYDNVEDAAKRWIDSAVAWRNFKKGIENNSYIEIAYEDFVGDHRSVLKLVGDQFNITKRKNTVNITSILGDVTSTKHLERALHHIDQSSIGKGHQTLTVKDVEAIKNIVGSVPDQFGYKSVL